MAVDGCGRSRLHAGEQFGHLGLGERLEGDPAHRGARERGGEANGSLRSPKGEREEDRRVRSAPQERRQQLDRCLVGPMEVVEHDDQRAVPCEELEQLSRGPVGAVPLVGNGPALALGGTAQGRKDVGELPRVLRAPRFPELELLGGNVGVQRVGPDAERQVPLELRRRTAENEVPALLARRFSSVRRCVLPIPGSPSSAMQPDSPASRASSVASNCSSADSRPTVCPTLNSNGTLSTLLAAARSPVKGSPRCFATWSEAP